MPQYLLNIIQPVGEVPPPEDLEPGHAWTSPR